MAASRRRILVVDDDAVSRGLLAALLQSDGHEVGVADSGAQALSLCQRQEWDLVLMDLQMPDMDGFESAEAIRKAAVGGRGVARIVAMTATEDAQSLQRCRETGMWGHLRKPVGVADLRQVIERLGAEGHASAEPGASRPSPQSRPPDSPAYLDRALRKCLDRLNGDRGLYRELAGLFLTTFPRKAADVQSAIGAGNRQGAELAAHSIKGAASIVGARAVARMASQMEEMASRGDLTEMSVALQFCQEEFRVFGERIGRSGLMEPPVETGQSSSEPASAGRGQTGLAPTICPASCEGAPDA